MGTLDTGSEQQLEGGQNQSLLMMELEAVLPADPGVRRQCLEIMQEIFQQVGRDSEAFTVEMKRRLGAVLNIAQQRAVCDAVVAHFEEVVDGTLTSLLMEMGGMVMRQIGSQSVDPRKDVVSMPVPAEFQNYEPRMEGKKSLSELEGEELTSCARALLNGILTKTFVNRVTSDLHRGILIYRINEVERNGLLKRALMVMTGQEALSTWQKEYETVDFLESTFGRASDVNKILGELRILTEQLEGRYADGKMGWDEVAVLLDDYEFDTDGFVFKLFSSTIQYLVPGVENVENVDLARFDLKKLVDTASDILMGNVFSSSWANGDYLALNIDFVDREKWKIIDEYLMKEVFEYFKSKFS